ncbi:hypothetical protein JB92DRAFT_2734439 [Gautieria morchelliformis]|nr:hypothetical protein JB92DRAFT_2734439 [Gautieria morchelliformis]
MPSNTSSKRRRTKESIHDESESSSTYSRNCLHQLPLEMFAEILSYASSPDILSLARTSRFLCATLVTNPASLFIWKAARQRFQPKPIPDPAPNWTESAYIAFIFDTVPCEVCHRQTKRTPFSYALRARICDSVSVLKEPLTWRLVKSNQGKVSEHMDGVSLSRNLR